jgi:DNA-binding NtrC family response regulator
MSLSPHVLIVDDEPAVRTALEVNLTRHGMKVSVCEEPKLALTALRSETFDLVITDVRMPGGSGLELAERIREAWPELPLIVMTGHGSIGDAVRAMKAGASDYVIKPVTTEEILVVIERALANQAMRAELKALRQEVTDRYGFEKLIGATPVMLELYDEVAAVADTSATVLLEGPTGTGKELLAHAIHVRSRRSSGPFVRVNCAAIPETLLESELFGHERGAFTGAVRQHRGRFEQADGGTVLLDEIGEIDLQIQVKLLHVLENGEIQRVGGQGAQRVDVRIVAATNKNLLEETRAGRFRQDLYYRLNVVALNVPPLRARRDDIPLLVSHFLSLYAEKNERPAPQVTPAAMEMLMSYSWPGNVRQLEHMMERAVILNRTGTLERFKFPADESLDASPQPSVLPPPGTTLQESLADHERKLLIAALKASDGVQAKAARLLGLSRSNLNYRIQRLGIRVREIAYD